MNDREVIRRHSKSFALAARLLPRAERERAEALYAWCRAADDRIDCASDATAAIAALAELRAEVEDVYAGLPPATPAADALRRAVTQCDLPKEYPLELLAGFELDVRGVRYTTEAELLLYCHRVAGVVGLMMCHALGVTDDDALTHAAHLGMAMQLTNIARDVAEDWVRGRVYLPAEWLSRNIAPPEPLSDAVLAPAVRRCLDLAERYYNSGEDGLKYLAPRIRVAIATAARVYRTIGARIRACGCRPSAGRAVVPTWAKLAILARTACKLLPTLACNHAPVHQPRILGRFAPIPNLINSLSSQPEVCCESSTPILA